MSAPVQNNGFASIISSPQTPPPILVQTTTELLPYVGLGSYLQAANGMFGSLTSLGGAGQYTNSVSPIEHTVNTPNPLFSPSSPYAITSTYNGTCTSTVTASTCTPKCLSATTAPTADGHSLIDMAACTASCASQPCIAHDVAQIKQLRIYRILTAAYSDNTTLAVNSVPDTSFNEFIAYPDVTRSFVQPLSDAQIQALSTSFTQYPDGYMPYPFTSMQCVACTEAAINSAGNGNTSQVNTYIQSNCPQCYQTPQHTSLTR